MSKIVNVTKKNCAPQRGAGGGPDVPSQYTPGIATDYR